MLSPVESLGHVIARHPYRTAAIGAVALTASLVLPAIVPELVRYLRIRRM